MKKAAVGFLVIFLVLVRLTLSASAFDGNDYGGGGGGGYYGGGYGGGDDGGGYSNRNRSGSRLHIQLPDREEEIESIIKESDADFRACDFLSFAKKVYVDIQMAWCRRDLPSVRSLLHDNLYDATIKQIQSKINQGIIYRYENIKVNKAYLTSYAKDKQYEYLTIYLNARMIDWQEDEKTGAVLRGDKTTTWDLRYKMKFMRPAASFTASSDDYNWVLLDFATIRNDTVDEGIKLG